MKNNNSVAIVLYIEAPDLRVLNIESTTVRSPLSLSLSLSLFLSLFRFPFPPSLPPSLLSFSPLLSLFSSSQVLDLSPLLSFRQLQSLNVSRCPIERNIGPLASCSALSSLNLSHVPVDSQQLELLAGIFLPVLAFLHLVSLVCLCVSFFVLFYFRSAFKFILIA